MRKYEKLNLLLSKESYEGIFEGQSWQPYGYVDYEDATLDYLCEDYARTAAIVTEVSCVHNLMTLATPQQVLSVQSLLTHGHLPEAIVVMATCSELTRPSDRYYDFYSDDRNGLNFDDVAYREHVITELIILEAWHWMQEDLVGEYRYTTGIPLRGTAEDDEE